MERATYWKIALVIGIGLGLLAFLLGWIGFGVPDWHSLQRVNGSIQEYFGLWAYCQESSPLFNTICSHWPDAADQLFNGNTPSFITTAQGLVTTGMILLSFGLIAAVLAAVLPLTAYIAGALTFLGFFFLIIGIPIFGEESDELSELRGDATFNKLYGFDFMIAAIVLSFFAAIVLAIAGFLYQQFGFGNIASHSISQRVYRGQQRLGQPNVLESRSDVNGYPTITQGSLPYSTNLTTGTLLSGYVARRMPRYYGPTIVPRTGVTGLPQPTLAQSTAAPPYVLPDYYRTPSAVSPANVSTENPSS